MFGQISVAQRYLFSPSTIGNIFRPLFGCLLKVVLFPGLISLVLLYVLYNVADSKFTEWYFGLHNYVWEPAFPWSWRLVFLSLFVVPAFASLHLLWLSVAVLTSQGWRGRRNSHRGWSRGYIILPRSESNSLEERELSSIRDTGDCDSADVESDAGLSRHHTPFQHRKYHHLFPSGRFLQFLLWLAIMGTSLWLGLHYRHPGDLRYLPLIEKANAHPNRTGYANQGEYYDPSLCPRSTSLTDL